MNNAQASLGNPVSKNQRGKLASLHFLGADSAACCVALALRVCCESVAFMRTVCLVDLQATESCLLLMRLLLCCWFTVACFLVDDRYVHYICMHKCLYVTVIFFSMIVVSCFVVNLYPLRSVPGRQLVRNGYTVVWLNVNYSWKQVGLNFLQYMLFKLLHSLCFTINERLY